MVGKANSRSGQPDERTPLVAGRSRTSSNASSTSESQSLLSAEAISQDASQAPVPWFRILIPRFALRPSLKTATDEEQQPQPDAPTKFSKAFVLRVVTVLIIGNLIANADASLVLATHPTIASEFNDLEDSAWLFTAFTLAGCATQSIFAELSDIYGRRSLLVAAYFTLALGWYETIFRVVSKAYTDETILILSFVVGVGSSMGQVILGRVVSGSGGAGMGVLSMLLVTDLVPLRDLAAWQAGMNLLATLGRSLGGPVGGWLADTIGWRWSFLGQAPIFLLTLVLSVILIPSHIGRRDRTVAAPTTLAADSLPEQNGMTQPQSKLSALAKVDWTGSILLSLVILTLLLPIEVGGTKIPWTHPLMFILLGSSVLLAGLFSVNESRWARHPIFPISLLTDRTVVLSYLIAGSQTAAQLGLMYSVPLYFQITQGVSNTAAGAYLFPGVAGNAIGGILSGIIIKKTGRYKMTMVLGALASCLAYLALLLRWHGHTNAWEALFILPGGFGLGMVSSATFISVQAAVSRSTKAAATSGMYLVMSIGMIIGLAGVGAVVTEVMTTSLASRLAEMGLDENTRQEIVRKAASTVDYIRHTDPAISKEIVTAYVKGLSYGHALSLGLSVFALLAPIHRLLNNECGTCLERYVNDVEPNINVAPNPHIFPLPGTIIATTTQQQFIDMADQGRQTDSRWPSGARAAISFTMDNLGEAQDVNKGVWPADQPVGNHFSVRENLPRMFDMLDKYGIKATYFAESWSLDVYPQVVAELQTRGHEVAWHGFQHEVWSSLSQADEELNFKKSWAKASEVGIEYRGFRPPGGSINDRTYGLFQQYGIKYVSPLDKGASKVRGITVLPFDWREVDAFYYMEKFASIRKKYGETEVPLSPKAFRDHLLSEMKSLVEAGGYMSILFHPFLQTSEEKFAVLEEVLEYLSKHKEIWCAPCEQVEKWLADHPELMETEK